MANDARRNERAYTDPQGYLADPTDDELADVAARLAQPLPTHAVLKGRGKVRVLSYDGNGMFTVLTNRDVKVFTHRDKLTFTKR